jgi:hypothetical protein
MDEQGLSARRQPHRTSRGGALGLVFVLLVGGPALAGCAGTHDASTGAWTAMPTMDGAVPTVVPAEALTAPSGAAAVDAMWATRPSYTGTTDMTEAAYHYAISHPDIVKWMPCYCGCGGMGHGSNLACYLKPDGSWEEHASFCDICVKITLKTKALVEQGKSLREIRQIIDDTWGGFPSTPTDLPPA